MSFGNIFFIFIFMAVSLLIYHIIPRNLMMVKNIILLAFSLLFYSWGNPHYIVLILFSIVFNYVCGLELQHLADSEEQKYKKISLIVTIVVNLFILCFFKYYGFLINTVNSITGAQLKYTELATPLGVSFYTFTVLSYIFDVYYGKVKAQRNFINYSVYVTFFPKLVSGPIVQYKDMEDQLMNRRIDSVKFGSGMNMFIVGLAKKVLIADNLGVAFSAIQGMENMASMTAWLGMIFYSLELYFDFSGYSDMAIGLAKMFGFDFKENFNYPYLSKSITEFWRRWHISLGTWFKDYVYIPLGGNRVSTKMHIRNLLIVWFLTGLWHGASWNFIVWGLWHGAFVLLEKYVLKDYMEKWPDFVRVIYSIAVAFFGWVWFFNDSMASSLHYFGQMFGAGNMGIADSTSIYYLATNLILLIIAIIGCGPMVKKMHEYYVYKKGGMALYVSMAGFIVLFVLCVAYLVNNTYSSFLYFQF